MKNEVNTQSEEKSRRFLLVTLAIFALIIIHSMTYTALNLTSEMTQVRETLDESLTTLSPGTYIVGRDIEAGTYQGEAGADKCYWERLGNFTGRCANILAKNNSSGQYFIVVLPTDFALWVGCEVEKID